MGNKTHLILRAINEHGQVVETDIITPNPGQGEPTCKHYGCNSTVESWRACQCSADCWTHARDWRRENRCCKDYVATCPKLASCESFGCFGKYDGKKPCQCNKGCEKRNNCCSDYGTLCNTPEAQQADASCATNCEVEGKKGSYTCQARVDYGVKRQRKKVADMIDKVNDECKGQCNCTLKYYSQGSSSLIEENAEDSSEINEEHVELADAFEEAWESDDTPDELSENQHSLLEKKILLEEELRAIDHKLSGSSEPWADDDIEKLYYMN